MGEHWDEFKDRLGSKLVGIGMVLFDLLVLLVLGALMVLADDGREWLTHHIGEGSLFTRITLIGVEVVLDLSVVAVVLGWLVEEIKRIFK